MAWIWSIDISAVKASNLYPGDLTDDCLSVENWYCESLNK